MKDQPRQLTTYDDIYCVSEQIVPIDLGRVESNRALVGGSFPPGYEEFFLRFGVGDFSGYVRPYPPERVVQELDENRKLLSCDFWPGGGLQLSTAEKAQLVAIGDTIDSDFFAFHPRDPAEMFVFPRHKDSVFSIRSTFIDLLNWVAQSGRIVQPFSCFFFQPWNGFATIRFLDTNELYSVGWMAALFGELGPASYAIQTDDSVDYFLKPFGAHLQYYCHGGYVQFIISFDATKAREFCGMIAHLLRDLEFLISEHYKIDKALLVECGFQLVPHLR